MTALTPALQFRVATCHACGVAALPWAMGIDDDSDDIIWGCSRCDAVLGADSLQSATAVSPADLSEFGYILDREGEAGGCGSDGGGCSSCGSRSRHD